MLSLIDLATRIDSGALAPDAALDRARAAIAERDGSVCAFVRPPSAAAAALQGPLRGIAVGVKDIIDTADMPTEMGSPIYAGWQPRADAPVIAALRRAGATPIGKTTTTAFAYLDPTVTRNPHNLDHTPGGSSSGSAAAVAAGMVPLALGTQTGGSVIRPASYCGVAAIKPSFRLIPTVGVKCFAWTLDTVGLFAAGIADLAFGLAALTGRADLRLDAAETAAPRLGVVAQDFAGDPEPESAAALARAVTALERAGARVATLVPPASLAAAWTAHAAIQDYEGRQALAWEYDHHRAALPPLIGGLLDAAAAVTAAAYDEARAVANRARDELAAVFGDVDALLTFSAPGPAPRGLASTGNSRFNRVWTLMGNPCVNVPAMPAPSGLPVGVQLICRFGRDGQALRAASFVETALRRFG